MAGFLSGMGAAIASSGLNFLGSAHSAKKAYKYSLKLQQHQNAWMEKMSNSVHQREVKDLREAGLNPILSATGGSGASTPSAGSATMGAVTPDLGSGIATALDFKRLKNETELKDSTKSLNKWQENKVIHEADVAHHSAAKLREETQLLQKYGPMLKEMEYLTFKNNIENANAVTAAQVRNLDSNTYQNLTQSKLNSAQTVKTQKETSNIRPVHGPRIEAGQFGSFGVAW